MSWRESPIPQRPAVPAPAAAVRARPAPRRRRSSPKSSRQLGALLETIPVANIRPGRDVPRGTPAAAPRLFRYIRYFYLLFQPFFVSTGPSGTRGGAAARPRARASYSEQFAIVPTSLLQLPARPGRLHSRVVRRARIRLGPARGRARSPHPAAAAQLHASPVQPRVRRATSRFSVGNSQG